MITYGIIFYEINHNSINIFLKKNSFDKYENIIINDKLDILPIYKIKLYESNHIIYLIDIKHNELFVICIEGGLPERPEIDSKYLNIRIMLSCYLLRKITRSLCFFSRVSMKMQVSTFISSKTFWRILKFLRK
jgi:hypothetical protein